MFSDKWKELAAKIKEPVAVVSVDERLKELAKTDITEYERVLSSHIEDMERFQNEKTASEIAQRETVEEAKEFLIEAFFRAGMTKKKSRGIVEHVLKNHIHEGFESTFFRCEEVASFLGLTLSDPEKSEQLTKNRCTSSP